MTDTTAHVIMHLTGEQARSALMLLASEHEEDIRAAVDRAQAPVYPSKPCQAARPVHAPLPEAATDPAKAAQFGDAMLATAERQMDSTPGRRAANPHLNVVR